MTTFTRRRLGAIGRILLGLVLLAAPLRAADDEVFAAVRTAFEAATTAAARLEVVKNFLDEYPDHPQLDEAVEAGTELLVGPLDDPAGAVDLAEKALERSGNPEVQQGIRAQLLKLYGAPEYQAKLQRLIAEMYDVDAMSYVDHLGVVRAATKAEDWPLVQRHVQAASHLASPEAFRADYPDRDFAPDEVAAAVLNRQGLLRTHEGWAFANQGDQARALDLFAIADGLVRRSYLGLPENALYEFWGRTLLMAGQDQLGIEKLALAGIFGRDEESYELARTAYEAVLYKKSWDDYVWELRRTHGARVDTFTALDYTDTPQTFAQLRGERATLLAFWFPT